MERSVLGKGLSALIPEKVETESGDSVRYLKISEIKTNRFQPRTRFSDEKLADLVASIREKGVIQPILVRKQDSGFEVIAGERRFRAAKALNLDKVPVIIKAVSDQDSLILALIENIQREELNPIEEANAFKKLIEDFDFTQDEVAQSVGKNRTTITNTVRLLKLPGFIQNGIEKSIISGGHARALLSVDDEKKQKQLFATTVEKKLSVRDLEDLVSLRIDRTEKKKKKFAQPQDIYIAASEEGLQRALGTKVRIKSKDQKRGKIVIDYYSSEDLNRIVSLIRS